MTSQDDPIRDEFIHQIGELANGLGLNRSVGQLYAVLYMSPEPMCLDEMARACGMSKGNVSLNVRALERWGAVERAYVSGDRKDYYRANRDVLSIAAGRLKEGLGRRLGALDAAVAQASKKVEQMQGEPRARQHYKERLQDIRKLTRSLQRVLNNLDKVYQLVKRFM